MKEVRSSAFRSSIDFSLSDGSLLIGLKHRLKSMLLLKAELRTFSRHYFFGSGQRQSSWVTIESNRGCWSEVSNARICSRARPRTTS